MSYKCNRIIIAPPSSSCPLLWCFLSSLWHSLHVYFHSSWWIIFLCGYFYNIVCQILFVRSSLHGHWVVFNAAVIICVTSIWSLLYWFSYIPGSRIVALYGNYVFETGSPFMAIMAWNSQESFICSLPASGVTSVSHHILFMFNSWGTFQLCSLESTPFTFPPALCKSLLSPRLPPHFFLLLCFS